MSNLIIYFRKDGRFEGRVCLGSDDNGKRKYKSYYGATAEEVKSKYEMAQLTYISTEAITKMTVSKLAAEWLLSVKNRVKESTLANYLMKLNKHTLPFFSEAICCEIRAAAIYAFINQKIDLGLSVRYVSDIIVLTKSIFRYVAREYGIKNVFDGISMPKKAVKGGALTH